MEQFFSDELKVFFHGIAGIFFEARLNCAINNWEEGVSKFRCTLWLYLMLYFCKQSPDFHKPGLCHVAKFLYLCDIQ